MEFIMDNLGAVLGILFSIIYFYQLVYILVGLFQKPVEFQAGTNHRYGVLISARNEENVIANLIESIQSQKYPRELVDIFVVADNCTDATAEAARRAGAIVYERFDQSLVGKGYALNYLLHQIDREYILDTYEGFFVFDADNLLDENFIAEMNKVFDSGYDILTGYRNSKNIGDNWISSGYGLWFLREARFVNQARMQLGTSCHVSGTGFLVRTTVLKENGGWKHHLLTEDIEFTVDQVIHGACIGYCKNAILYDEQPTTFAASWRQRIRWSKGFYQVFFHYGKQLLAGIFKPGGFAFYDMLILLFPGIAMSLGGAAGAVLSLGLMLLDQGVGMWLLHSISQMLLITCIDTYVGFFALGALTTAAEWKQIHCSTRKKILYLFTFPIFMASYVPISIVAMFSKVTWKPIPHTVVKKVADIQRI